jgi:SAM-dependent methyltransferase
MPGMLLSSSNITVSDAVTKCVISQQPVTKILDFGQHAYADTFIKADQLNLSEPVFPLQVFLNSNTGSIQLGYVSSAEDRYNLYSYSYTSSNSKTARDHWNECVSTIKQRGHSGLVVEIGSNDGYLVSQFDQAVAVDSSAEMCALSRARGVETVHALFDNNTADAIKNTHGAASVIIANNVFNHANDPVAFAQSVARLLSNTGEFVFEVPYWLSMIESNRFTDMVYHEHPTYFTIKMASNVLQAAGLEIFDFDVVDYHGGSLRVFARHATGADMPDKIQQAIDQETQMGLFDPEFYQGLQRKFEKAKVTWLANFYNLLAQDPNAVIIGVGAAAKANTWLRWHGLDSTVIRCITDASEHKQGKFTPLTRIPILADEEFARHPQPYALILSWNIGEGLRQAILNINPNTRFISQ